MSIEATEAMSVKAAHRIPFQLAMPKPSRRRRGPQVIIVSVATLTDSWPASTRKA